MTSIAFPAARGRPNAADPAFSAHHHDLGGPLDYVHQHTLLHRIRLGEYRMQRRFVTMGTASFDTSPCM